MLATRADVEDDCDKREEQTRIPGDGEALAIKYVGGNGSCLRTVS
jgi:hypothetical protein